SHAGLHRSRSPRSNPPSPPNDMRGVPMRGIPMPPILRPVPARAKARLGAIDAARSPGLRAIAGVAAGLTLACAVLTVLLACRRGLPLVRASAICLPYLLVPAVLLVPTVPLPPSDGGRGTRVIGGLAMPGVWELFVLPVAGGSF